MLFQERSIHHEITVYDTEELYGEKGNFRVLQFSHAAIQGAMDLNRPDRILFEYPRAMIHIMECNNPSFEDVFVIGHGIGTIANHFPGKRFKVAELDGKIVEISKRFFDYQRDDVIVGDGRHILQKEEPHTYDYIVLDAFTVQGTPRHLISQPFFKLTREKLDPRGLIILNLMGKSGNDKFINAIHTTLSEEYAYTKAFIQPSEGAAGMHNIILIARDMPIVYQTRHMAGFIEIELSQGYVIMEDNG